MNFRLRTSALAISTALTFPFTGMALAQTFTVTDINVTGENNSSFVIPTIEVTDSNLDEAGIRALFSTDRTVAFKGMATLDAASLKIPSMTMSYETPALDGTGGKITETVTYTDFELTDVQDGAARGGIRIGKMEIASPDVSLVVGETAASFFDMAATLAFYGFADSRAGDQIVPLYRDFTMASMHLTGPGLVCSVGAMTNAEASARPLRYDFNELVTRAQAIEAAEAAGTEPPTGDIVWMVNFYADFLTAITSTASTLDGMDCSVEDPLENRTIVLGLGKVEVGPFDIGVYPALSLNDLNLEVPTEGFFRFGNFTWKQTDFNPAIEALKAAGDALDLKWFETNWRKIIPSLDGLSFADLAFDIPNEESPGERITGGVGAFDLTMGNYVNGLPGTVASSTRNLTFALPETPETAPFRALGIEQLDLGMDFNVRWDEATKTIAVENIGVSGAKLGTFSVNGSIANAGPELFSTDENVALAASMAMTVTELTINLKNDGIAPLLIASAAAEQSVPVEALHQQLAVTARALPAAILGTSEEANKVGEAIGSLLEGTPNLTIKLTSIDPKGVGLAEFMAAQENPVLLKGKFTIVAESSGEKVPFVFPEITAPAAAAPVESPAPEADPTPPVAAPPASPRADDKLGGKN